MDTITEYQRRVATLFDDELADQLIELRQSIDRHEARWLTLLAEFDHREAWRHHGQLSAVDWLVAECGINRRTAREHLRVAHELTHRPLIAEQFAAGALSYSKVRAITRLTDVDDDTDTALLAAAKSATASDLEQLARHWELLRDQDDPRNAAERAWEKRGLRARRRYDGLTTTEIVAASDDTDRLLAAVDTYLHHCGSAEPVDVIEPGGSAEPGDPTGLGASAEAGNPTELGGSAEPGPATVATLAQRRADALVDLVEAGLAWLQAGGEVDIERAAVNVMVDYDLLACRGDGRAETDTGTVLTGDAARRLCCDAGIVRIVTRGRSQVLDVGRKTRQWTTAMRRAIRLRHEHRCAVPGCNRRITQIHHLDWWSDDGDTNVDLGVPLCSGHHRLVHDHGWQISSDPATGTIAFTSPRNHTITSRPIALPQ